jgi:hypothetical protein
LKEYSKARCVKEGGKITLSIGWLKHQPKIRCVKEGGKITLSIG